LMGLKNFWDLHRVGFYSVFSRFYIHKILAIYGGHLLGAAPPPGGSARARSTLVCGYEHKVNYILQSYFCAIAISSQRVNYILQHARYKPAAQIAKYH